MSKKQLQIERVRTAEHYDRMNTFGASFNHALSKKEDPKTPIYELRRGDVTKAVVRIPVVPIVIAGWHPAVDPIDVHEGLQAITGYLKIESQAKQMKMGNVAVDIDHPKFTNPLLAKYGLLPTGLQLFDIDTT